MKRKLNTRTLIFILALVAIAGYAVYAFVLPTFNRTEYIPYNEFYSAVENGNVTNVTIAEKDITFETKTGTSVLTSNSATTENSTTGTSAVTGKFKTDNPDSPTLKEFLLKNKVAVSEETDTAELFSLIFDILFYVFFFGIIIIAFRKFISPNTFRVARKTGVTFNDVIGMDNLKRDMIKVIDIMKNPAEYRAKGIRMPKGILLEGAPGNGKTLFARALAGEAKIKFIPAKATDFESMFMAIGPMKVKLLFHKARKQAPCIVFIDEFDGIGTKRNYSGSAIETENTRIVTALLNELDGFTQNDGILVLAATNSRQALDEALIRPGRFDAKYTVPYPDTASRIKLIELYTQGKQAGDDCTSEILAKRFEGYSCAQIESVINRAAILAGADNRTAYSMDDIKTAIKEI